MRTYEKLAINDEKELLNNLLTKRILRPKQKIFHKISTPMVDYELIGIGRLPIGLDVKENPLELAAIPLDTNDIFTNEHHESQAGKYRIVTKSYTAGSDKFDAVDVRYDNVLDFYKQNCIDHEPLGATMQTISKRRTHMSIEEQIQSITIRMYYKFKFI